MVIEAVAVAIQAGVPCLLTSIPGEGKTALVGAMFEQLCKDHHTSIVALHEPPEYGGYPVPQDDGVALLPVAWVNRLALVREGIAGLFLDEIGNGAPATRSAAMRGILDGTWGERTIERLSTVAAQNPPECSENGTELSAPLANRFCHIAWDMPVQYWAEAMLGGFPKPKVGRLPDKWRERLPWARGLVAAFAAVKPGTIKAMPKETSARAGAWPSLRTWTMTMDLLAACRAMGYGTEHDVTRILVGGCLGDGAALEFLTWVSEQDLPDPEAVLKNPKSLALPDRGDRCYAVLTSIVAAVLANNTPPRWIAAWEVLEQAVAQNRPDVAASSARALARNRPAGVDPPKAINAFLPLLKAAGLLG
jgi:phage tail protein X